MKLEPAGGSRDHIYNETEPTMTQQQILYLYSTYARQIVRTIRGDNITFKCPDGPAIVTHCTSFKRINGWFHLSFQLI